MSIARGIITGFLGAAIADKQAKDNAYLDVAKSAGINYYNTILPETTEAEDVRRKNYEMLVGLYDVNTANLFDKNDFTVNKESMKRLDEFLETNKIDKEKLKSANFATTYEDRYKQRGESFQNKYSHITKMMGKQIGGLGPYTVKSQLEGDTEMDTTKAPTTPMEENVKFSPMKLSEFVMPIQTAVDLGTPNQVDQAISGFRGFDQGIIKDATGAFAGMELFGEKANERNAFKAVMTRIGGNFKIPKTEKADLTATAGAANQILFDQTQGYIGSVLDGYQATSFKEKIREKSFDINRYNATGFSKNFNDTYKTDDEKIIALVNYMNDNLQTRSERLHFAQSFAANIKDSDGNNYRDLLLIAVDPTLVIQGN